MEKMIQVRKDATEALKKAAKDMKRFYDKHKRSPVNYEVGTKVWLDGRNIKTYRPSPKLNHKRLGPFLVEEKIGSSSYRLKLPVSWNRVHPVFNEVLLSPYHTPSYDSQIPPPPPQPIIVDDYPEYDVEEVLATWKRGRGIQYLIKWQGYDHTENTWEPRRNLTNIDELLADFYHTNPKAVHALYQIIQDSPTQSLSLVVRDEQSKSRDNVRTCYSTDSYPSPPVPLHAVTW